MIKKLWCWMWGHKFVGSFLTGEYITVFNGIHYVKQPVIKHSKLEYCRRCGERL